MTARRAALAPLALALALALSGCGSAVPASRGTEAEEPPASASLARASSVAAPPSPTVSLAEISDLLNPTAAPAGDVADVAGYRAFVRRQLASDATYERLIYVLLIDFFENGRTVNVIGHALQEGTSRRRGRFYYLETPCPDRELVRVRPWWAPGQEITICGRDHRPTVLDDKGGRTCDQTYEPLDPAEGCGCGPDLMFCAPADMIDAIREAHFTEIKQTIKHLIVDDRPFSEIFTANATVRPALADLWYSRIQFFRTGTFTPPDLSQPVSLRPRDPMFKGGLLSTPVLLFTDGQRAIVNFVWRDFTCAPLVGANVSTHTLLEATRDKANLRARSFMHLTTLQGCQNCHARLEYGQIAYAGWQNALLGMHYIDPTQTAPALQARFYMRDHLDLRGEGTPDLDWLGRTMTSQPEFSRCMVKKVAAMVYEGANNVPRAVEDRLAAGFERGQRFGALIEDAVVARAFGLAALPRVP